MAVLQIEDNHFSPQIAALAMPSDKDNGFSALGDALTSWGKNYNANQLFDLQKTQAQTNIDKANLDMQAQQQSMDFSTQYNPLKIRAATIEADAKDKDYHDALAKDWVRGVFAHAPDSKTAAQWAQDFNNEHGAGGYEYTTPDGRNTLTIDNGHVASVLNEMRGTEAKLAQEKAQTNKANADANEASAKAGYYRQAGIAKANPTQKPISIASMGKIASEASRASVAANAFDGLLNNYDDSRVGWYDNMLDSAKNAVGVNTEDGTANALIKQNLTSLVGASKDLIDLKGQDSKAKLALVDAMTPNMTDTENEFKAKTRSLYKFINDSYESKLKTYDPNNATPEQYAAWAGNIAALQAIKPKLDKFANQTKEKPKPQLIDIGISSDGTNITLDYGSYQKLVGGK